MGYRGTIRKLVAISNASDREARSYQRLLERRQALYDKMQEMEENTKTVNCFNEYIERIQTLHRECKSSYNWEQMKKEKPPRKPVYSNQKEKEASVALETFKPSFFDKLFKRERKKIKQLQDNLATAKLADEECYNQLLTQYTEKEKEHNERVEFATKILEKDLTAYNDAIDELSPLEDLKEIGVIVEYPVIEKDKIKVNILNDNEAIIPKEQFSLLKSGKISVKDMPVSKRNEIYQDYICSSALRIARELFALLPIDEVITNIKSNLLDTSTGKKGYQTILSVKFIRETMETINFDAIDPSDCMKNFIHNMNYKKTQGMFPVQEIE